MLTWFLVYGFGWELQGGIELCVFIFNHFCAYWCNHPLQHWAKLWWASFSHLWLVNSRYFHHACWVVHGWDLFLLSYLWWPLLLECQACWPTMGTLCLMDDWLVIIFSASFLTSSISTYFDGLPYKLWFTIIRQRHGGKNLFHSLIAFIISFCCAFSLFDTLLLWLDLEKVIYLLRSSSDSWNLRVTNSWDLQYFEELIGF
jgi:hypothetical protein